MWKVVWTVLSVIVFVIDELSCTTLLMKTDVLTFVIKLVSQLCFLKIFMYHINMFDSIVHDNGCPRQWNQTDNRQETTAMSPVDKKLASRRVRCGTISLRNIKWLWKYLDLFTRTQLSFFTSRMSSYLCRTIKFLLVVLNYKNRTRGVNFVLNTHTHTHQKLFFIL